LLQAAVDAGATADLGVSPVGGRGAAERGGGGERGGSLQHVAAALR
jgi:hypothetical protein